MERVEERAWRQVSAKIEALSYESREEWLAIRRMGLGGSDAGPATGLSKYKTRYRLYGEKRGEIPEDDLSDKLAVELGNRLEATVADMYADRTGRKLHRVNEVLRLRELPHMFVNLDRRVVGERRCVECKTSGIVTGHVSDEWGPDRSDQVPSNVYAQAEHQLAVTGYDTCDVPALLGDGLGFRIYTIGRDETMIANIIKLEADLWDRIQRGDPPPPENLDDLKIMFPKHVERPIESTAEILKAANALAELRKSVSASKSEIEALEFQIGAFMGDADTLVANGNPVLTYRTQTRKGYAVAESSFRVMRIKESKKK
jgi:putative phage-type endonuclease